jgi:8-oxo-dGTP diphosphatase
MRRRGGLQVAAGCLVWRERAGTLEVLLVHRPHYDDWSWPKGKLEPGEHPAEAACREVAEETGQHVVLGAPLPPVRYRIAGRRHKHVYYWAARPAVDDDAPALRARLPVQPADRREIDQVRWYEVGRARRRLTRRSDRRPLDELVAMWRGGTLRTRAVIVLRHARAVKRQAWDGDEASRPLTPMGRARAEHGVGVLAAYGVREVQTSPWQRCRQTVEPYARATHLTSRDIPEVTEASAREAPGEAKRAMRSALRRGQPVVLCSHRPVLGLLCGVVRGAAGASRAVRRAIPKADPYLRTAELLVAHVVERPTGRVEPDGAETEVGGAARSGATGGDGRGSGGVTVVAVERHRAGG